MRDRRRFLAAGAGLVTASVLPNIAWADRSKAERYTKDHPRSDIDTGGAIIGIHKPMEDVLRVVMKFRNYHKILPRHQTSRSPVPALGARRAKRSPAK